MAMSRNFIGSVGTAIQKRMWLWSMSGRVYNPGREADVYVPNWIHKA